MNAMTESSKIDKLLSIFAEDGDSDVTPTVGSFKSCNAYNNFDNIFEEACNNYQERWKMPYTIGFTKPETLGNPDMVASFKNDLLSTLKDDCTRMATMFEDGDSGYAPKMYENVSQLFDNKMTEYITEAQTVGDLKPIKTIDYPLLVKAHIKESFNSIVATEASPDLLVKKRIEHMIVYNRKDPSQAWEYPQCMYDPEFNKLVAAGEGVSLKTEPQNLPLYQFNMIEGLTDIPAPNGQRVVIDLEIQQVVTQDGTVVTLSAPMHVDLSSGAWVGGVIDELYTKKTPTTGGTPGSSTPSGSVTVGTQERLQDILSGYTDWQTNTTTLVAANNQVKAVIFSGKLSNERNENTLRTRYAQTERQWTIGEGCKIDASYTLEEIQEHKALAQFDLYKRSYNDITMLLSAIADKKGYMWLDEMFAKYDGVNLNPLDWNPIVLKTKFDCDSTTRTVALPSEYIAKELKFLIDRFVIDIADTVKLEDIHFVIYGNPRYISLINPSVHWVFQAGQSVGGVKLDYSYGVMTSNNVKIYVVSSKLIDASTHRCLRMIPFFDGGITFKRYKFATDVVTAKESGYKDPDHTAGSMTYVFGVERYADIALQAIQGEIGLLNDDFIYIHNN